ncbi:MAG: HAMP domain-containing histidine kinase [Clostridia bacterium]|nr:HAMP domain-containing histidine kinase [Clostridia bacterium]
MKRKKFSFLGYCLFFTTVAVTVMISVLIYSQLGECSNFAVAAVMLAVIAVLSLLCTLVDFLRRRFIDSRITDDVVNMTNLLIKGNYGVRLTPRHPYNKYDEYDIIIENLNSLAVELGKTEIMRSDFISNVSHEIKTPLSVICGYASALKNGKLKGVDKEKYLDALIRATERLSDLVMNILKLNKLENKTVATDLSKFGLDELLRECILDFEEKIDGKNLTLDCDLQDMEIYSDKTFIQTIVSNLISNAVKFTDGGGKISVGLKDEGGYAVITVADTGEGISSEVGGHIFDKFYQGDTSHAAEGNGLGLAMVKRIIDVLGGEISVHSVPGEGSVFTVKLKGAAN